jgi:hypothetical protein
VRSDCGTVRSSAAGLSGPACSRVRSSSSSVAGTDVWRDHRRSHAKLTMSLADAECTTRVREPRRPMTAALPVEAPEAFPDDPGPTRARAPGAGSGGRAMTAATRRARRRAA